MFPAAIARALGTVTLAVAVFASAAATADAPSLAMPPLRILVGFTAGGTTDLAARLLAERLQESLGRTVIVDNRPGASGRIAAVALKRAAPDGSTLMLAPMVVTTLAPLVWPQLDYDPAKDFAPVAHVADYAIALAVNNDVPARNVSEFAAWTKERAERASFGVSAAGGLPHLFGEVVSRATASAWVAVPYRGLAPMEVDLIGGRVPAAFDALSNLIELHRAGRVRIIATSGAKRSSMLPEISTFREQGLEGIDGSGWIAIHAPAGTPTATLEELSSAINFVLRKPEVRQRMIRLGLEPTGTTATELAEIASSETVRWSRVIKAVRFQGE